MGKTYICYRCNYTTNQKCNMKTHINRKNICIAAFNDIEIDKCKNYILLGYKYEDYINIMNSSNNKFINTKSTITTTQSSITDTQSHNNIECEYCNKVFNRKDSLTRHLKVCKTKYNIINGLKNKINELESNNKELNNIINKLKNDNKKLNNDNEELKEFSDELLIEMKKTNKLLLEQQKMINNKNTTNNTNNTITGNNNNINNIAINAFNNTKLDCLTNDEIYECLKTMSDSYVKALEKIHFNENNPENQNIYISNLRIDTMRIFNGNLWTTTDKEEILVKICDNFTSIFDDFIGYCENNNKFPKLQSKYYKYQQQITDNDEEYDKMYKKVENSIYDNSKVIKIKPP